MKKYRVRIRLKIYPVLWCIIILTSVYLLIRFAALSFSGDIGQAGFMDAIVSKLCTRVIEAGPSLISYTADGESSNSLLLNLVEDRLALQSFMIEDKFPTAYAQGYSSMFQNYGAAAEAEEVDLKDAAIAVSNPSSYIGFYDIARDYLGLEYILTNGKVIQSEAAGRLIWDDDLSEDQLNIGYLKGDVSPAAPESSAQDENTVAAEAISTGQSVEYTIEQLKDINFLIRNFYFVDASTVVTDSLFNAEQLVGKDMTMKQGNDAPQILIYHTHSEEAYADSRPGVVDDTIVGVGSYLAQILSDDYGYNVIHDTTHYETIGLKGYNDSYTMAEAGISKDLEENPTIEVVIDLHRNSGNGKLVMINGVEVAQIMLFNGLCRDQNGPLTNLDNPYLQENLAFSLQLQMKALKLYPGFFNRNYLKSYRFNMHMRPKSLLVELGTVKNSLQSAKNAIVPFAQILDAVLKGEAVQIE